MRSSPAHIWGLVLGFSLEVFVFPAGVCREGFAFDAGLCHKILGLYVAATCSCTRMEVMCRIDSQIVFTLMDSDGVARRVLVGWVAPFAARLRSQTLYFIMQTS